MRRSSRALCACSILLLLVAAEAAPPAPPAAWRTVQRRAWKMDIPADWRFESSIYYGEDGRRATWRIVSPNRNWQLTVRLERDEKQPLKELATWRWATTDAEAEELEVLDEKLETIEGRELYFRIAAAAAARKKNVHPFLVLGLYTRSPTKAVLVGVTLRATDEKHETFMEVVERMLESLEIKGLPVRKKAAAKKEGK